MVLCKSWWYLKWYFGDVLVMSSLKLSLNKRKLLFWHLGFALCQIFANLQKKKKKRLKQENAVVLQLGYPRYQNNPLCKTVVWCRIQSYFKDLPKENCAKWEKSPSCFILQNKPNWKYLKDLVRGKKRPCNPCSSNIFCYFPAPGFIWHGSFSIRTIRNFSDVLCVVLSFGEVEPSFTNSPINDWDTTRLGWWLYGAPYRDRTYRDFLALEPRTIEDSNQDVNNRELSLCRQHQAAIQKAACPKAPVWTGGNTGNAAALLW